MGQKMSTGTIYQMTIWTGDFPHGQLIDTNELTIPTPDGVVMINASHAGFITTYQANDRYKSPMKNTHYTGMTKIIKKNIPLGNPELSEFIANAKQLSKLEKRQKKLEELLLHYGNEVMSMETNYTAATDAYNRELAQLNEPIPTINLTGDEVLDYLKTTRNNTLDKLVSHFAVDQRALLALLETLKDQRKVWNSGDRWQLTGMDIVHESA